MAHLRPELDEIGPADTYRCQYVLSPDRRERIDSNHLFSIDSDGFLRTSLIHDFESNSTYSIRVRVTDEHNGSLEKTFAIQISDANEPASGDVLISGVWL